MTDYIVNSHRVGAVGSKLNISKHITDKVLAYLLKAGFITEASQAPTKSAKTEPKQELTEE
jgi:hypothetical protein